MNKPSVSILTLTQLSRSECLKILFDCIKNQSYKNIKEWIIVDGSKSLDEGMCNQVFITELINSDKSINFTINYIGYQKDKNLHQLKNIAHSKATGDYIIWMDDDDYHMASRIEYSVNKLYFNNKKVGGNFNTYLHDIKSGLTFKTNSPNDTEPNILPNSLIFKREFLSNHFYPETMNFFIDERAFLGDSVNDFEVLIPETSFVKLIHWDNTVKADQLIELASQDKLSTMLKMEPSVRKFLIPDNFYDKYVNALKPLENIKNDANTNISVNKSIPEIDNKTINYDIVYYTGVHSIQWDPEDKTLGGSEQAVVHLSENWSKFGKKVVVYGNFAEEKTINGVDYKLGKDYPFNKRAKVLIIWRHVGMAPFIIQDIEPLADNIVLDFHDNFSYTLAQFERSKLLKLVEKATKANFKSEYHKNCFEEFIGGKIDSSEYNIIANGVRVEQFKNESCLNGEQPIIRNPYRFCYCSSYDRGLEYILENVWPHIYKQEPRAEFHVYYGMDHIYDDAYKTRLRQLLSQPGVMEHGRQSMDMIIREKHMSTFHLYLSSSIAEIDCISVRESLVAGCIPVISRTGVFADRHGLQYNWDPSSKDLGKAIALDIINRMNDKQFIESARTQLMGSNTIIGWEDVAKQWLQTF